jgi:hypothetical protein
MIACSSALTGTDPVVLGKTDPLCAQVFVDAEVVASRSARQGAS